MQLQLRSPATGRLPLARPLPSAAASRFPGFRPQAKHWGVAGLGQSNINPTTIWTPSTGFTNPTYGAPLPAVYQAPTLVPVPACASSPDANTADSPECIAAVLAAQQQNFQLQNNANYAVDLQNCLNTVPQPPDCYQRTFGLTPAGGYTSDASVSGPTLYMDAAGNNFVTPPPGAFGVATSPGPGIAPSGVPQFSFTNLTSGDNYNFKVGDRWQIVITGAAPNVPVTVTGGMNGGSAISNMGSTDSSGRFSLNGQMDQSQVGNWAEKWQAGGVTVGLFQFVVKPLGSVVSSGTGTGGGTQTPTSNTFTSVFGTLPGGSVQIGGTSIPVLALGAGALVLFFMMRGK